MTNEQIRCFKRVLKELGIYTIWIKERKKSTHVVNEDELINFNPYQTFASIIDDSFWWDETTHPCLWDRLYVAKPSKKTIDELAKDQQGLKDIKEQIKDLL